MSYATKPAAADPAHSSELPESACDQPSAVIHYPDGVIEHPNGTLELDGYLFEIDWDELDPPEGHPEADAEEIPNAQVFEEMYAIIRAARGSL